MSKYMSQFILLALNTLVLSFSNTSALYCSSPLWLFPYTYHYKIAQRILLNLKPSGGYYCKYESPSILQGVLPTMILSIVVTLFLSFHFQKIKLESTEIELLKNLEYFRSLCILFSVLLS